MFTNSGTGKCYLSKGTMLGQEHMYVRLTGIDVRRK